MDTHIDTIDTPLAIIISIAISFIIAAVLLAAAPALLIDYGLAIAYTYAVIMATWVGIEVLHADFEDSEFATDRERGIVESLRRARAEHDSFGVGIGHNDPLWLTMVDLEERGYVERASSYNDDIDDCWWRATV